MSRHIEPNILADQVIRAARFATPDHRDFHNRIRVEFEHHTRGANEYERNEVAALVNFRLAAATV